MNILYVSNFRDGTGWSQAALNYALALDAAGAHVVCRPLRLNGNANPELPARYLELESRPAVQFDCVVQHALPDLMDINPDCGKNVGLFVSETSHFRGTLWAERLNRMDAVVVANRQMLTACRDSGVTRPLHVVGHPCDTDRYTRTFRPIGSLQALKDQGLFLFYTVGEAVTRKNLAGLVQAFHAEFGPDEPVRLVIKTSVPGMSPERARQAVEALCERARADLRLRRPAQPLVVMTERLTDDSLLRLHASCDVFVTASRGEAWCIPAFDAMALGKTPICPASTGFLDWHGDDVGYSFATWTTPCLGAHDALPGLFTVEQDWWEPVEWALRSMMRRSFEDEAERRARARAGRRAAFRYDLGTVGGAFLNVLEGVLRAP